MQDLKPSIPPQPKKSLKSAVYCAECKYFDQKIVGSKKGTCFDIRILNSISPRNCPYFQNDTRIISLLIFLKNGISIYNKAIVKNIAKEIDPNLLSSFLQAITMFGQELASEQISQIKFQKINIVFCRGKYTNGAMIVKGNLDKHCKEIFSLFIDKLESSYPEFFEGEYRGICLPEAEIDKIAIQFMKDYIREKFYPISQDLMEKRYELKCGATSIQK